MNEKEIIVSRMLWFIIILILILMLLYYFYISHLLTRECNFMDSLYSKVNGNIRNLNPKDETCGYTFKDYYIKSAFNCCSGGQYKNDYVSLCNLKDVLKQGTRGLDMEVYNINDEPVIATSTQDSFFIKETFNYVSFVDVLNVIRNYAFSGSNSPNPNDPVILHLRIKSNNQELYTRMAQLLKSYESYLLGKAYSYENNGHNLGDVPLLQFSGKIVVIVERNNTSFLENKAFMEFVNMTSSSTFMRALRYYDIINCPDLLELQMYNKQNMTIGMPDVGSNPTNPSSIVMREAGVQMLALRCQMVDQNLEENNTFFDKSGYAFSLKPLKLRYVPETIDIPPPQNPQYSFETRNVQSDFYQFSV
jgi:hypothetical protein